MIKDYLSRLSSHEPACLHKTSSILSKPVGPKFQITPSRTNGTLLNGISSQKDDKCNPNLIPSQESGECWRMKNVIKLLKIVSTPFNFFPSATILHAMENFVVSARKYRPSGFDEVVGQEHITTTLKNAIDNNKLAPGTRYSAVPAVWVKQPAPVSWPGL